jgi:biofilm PGA synthesis N-glycosyltransferase PgaC
MTVRDDAVVVGIMAYNEAANIGRTVRSIQEQTIAGRISRIIVVASGCTDDTCEIVARMAGGDPRIVLVEERLRAGKTVAINTFLAAIHESIVVIPSADLILERDTLEHLIAPLDDPRVGMVGAHPVPTNDRDTFIGFAVNLMWELHHRIASVEPKMGELVAFRNQFAVLDPAVLSDELSVEHKIRSAGLRIAYAPDARVFNRGPETLREFVEQRVRWCVAQLRDARLDALGRKRAARGARAGRRDPAASGLARNRRGARGVLPAARLCQLDDQAARRPVSCVAAAALDKERNTR